MSYDDLVSQLRAAGDPPHLMAAEALGNLGTIAGHLQGRVSQREEIARLNGETIRGMQQAAREEESDFAKRQERALVAELRSTAPMRDDSLVGNPE